MPTIHGMKFELDEEFRQRNRKHNSQERANLGILIEQEGCKADALTVAQIGTQLLLCDGYSTLSICEEKGIKPTAPRLVPFQDRQSVLEWIDRVQEGRRNLTAEELAAKRSERIERVAVARQEGKSVRTIAEEEGKSVSTIHGDIEAATVRGRTVEPKSGKTKGKDKKLRPSTRPSKPAAGLPGPTIPERFKNRQTAAVPAPEPPPPDTQQCPTCKGCGRIPKIMFGEMFAAIVKATNCDPKVNGGQVGKTVKALLAADPPYEPVEVLKLPAIIKKVWPKVPCTVGVLEKYISWTRNGTPASETELERLRREVGA